MTAITDDKQRQTNKRWWRSSKSDTHTQQRQQRNPAAVSGYDIIVFSCRISISVVATGVVVVIVDRIEIDWSRSVQRSLYTVPANCLHKRAPSRTDRACCDDGQRETGTSHCSPSCRFDDSFPLQGHGRSRTQHAARQGTAAGAAIGASQGLARTTARGCVRACHQNSHIGINWGGFSRVQWN